MHGRPRLPAAKSGEDSKGRGKARKLNLLLEEVLRNHHEKCYTKEALKQNADLLELNPEVYTAWNYRKLAVRHLMDLEPDDFERKLLAENELRLVERALRANVKSYGAWYHRKWIIDFGLSSMDHEFLLLKKLLKDDSRNFHGWDYRRFVVRSQKVSAEKELIYTTEKINENFSNYSAWHYRSTLLSQLVKGEVSEEDILKDEYQLVNQAYFTEPDDQSAWFYNTWLLGETKIYSGAHVVGTWPLDGSTVSADADKKSLSVFITSRTPLGNKYNFHWKEGVPIILSFSEVVANVTVKVRSYPELGDPNDICWRSLSSIQGPSKVWVAEIPLHGCPEGDYGIALQISSPDAVHGEVKFNLQVAAGHVFREDIDSDPARETLTGAVIWPREVAVDGEKEDTMHKLEQETIFSSVKQGDQVADLDVILLSGEFHKKTDMTAVEKVDWQQRILEEQIKNLQDLLELEKNSKWAKLTLSRVLLAHSAQTHDYGQYKDVVLDILQELTRIDPVHTEFYESLLSSIFIAKVLRNPTSLKRLWWDFNKAAGEHVEAVGWLRWNGLSLRKFDSVERLLWVQRLDLSHNQLHSVDGLEAMQLLVALDLSHNLITHVTSLAALRLIPKLQFLNIADNEIGIHPVDSSRYSFPSVLTNQVKPSCLKDGEKDKDVIVKDQWEVQAVFGGMNLKVVEIAGNVAARNKVFRDALVKALPVLELLDGEKV